MSNRIRQAEDGNADGNFVAVDSDAGVEGSAPTPGIVTSSNRLVRKDGSLAAGRACAASVRAARQARSGAPEKP